MFLVKRFWNWLKGLWRDVSGEDMTVVVPEVEEGQEGQEGQEGEDGAEGSEGSGSDGDAGQTGGNKPGDRSEYIPRERFDQRNLRANELDRLVEIGVLTEGEDGKFHVNQQNLPQNQKSEANAGAEKAPTRFVKDDMADDSWPIGEKINTMFDEVSAHYDGLVDRAAYLIFEAQSTIQAIMHNPDFLSTIDPVTREVKESPLRKMAMEIMKNDAEFKAAHSKNPKKLLFAIKRAREKLAGKTPTKPKPKKKPSFIVGKGDKGAGGVKRVNLAELSSAQLDELEEKEHKRLQGQKK